MKRFSRPMLGLVYAALGGLMTFAVHNRLLGRDAEPLPRFKIEDASVSRDARSVSSYAPIIKHAAPRVVNIYSTSTVRVHPMMNPFFNDPLFRQFFGDQGQSGRTLTRKEQSLGSGVIISPDGYILTANHVVDGADPNGVKVTLASGGKEYTAKIVGADPPTDVAVLKINASNLAAITIANSDQLEVGDVVLAIGNPFGVGQTVTMGIVSALRRTSLGIIPEGYENFIQTDAAINPGNSGGALVDAEGRLVGINTAILSGSGGYQGVGFAVPVNMARSVMDRLIKFGKVTRGSLGVWLQPEITPELAQEFNLPDTQGAMVGGVVPNSAASRAGLKPGDVIRAVDGKPVSDSGQLRLMISQAGPGTKVTLRILRSEPGQKPAEKTITATLTELRQSATGPRFRRGSDEGTPARDALDGVEVTDLDAATRRELNIPSNVQGALVTDVAGGSNAAEAGLHQGDVILEINRQPVRSADDAVELSNRAKGNRVLLRVWREGGSFFVAVDNSPSEK